MGARVKSTEFLADREISIQSLTHFRARPVQKHPLIGVADPQNATNLFRGPSLNAAQSEDLALAGRKGFNRSLCVCLQFLRKKRLFGCSAPVVGLCDPATRPSGIASVELSAVGRGLTRPPFHIEDRRKGDQATLSLTARLRTIEEDLKDPGLQRTP